MEGQLKKYVAEQFILSMRRATPLKDMELAAANAEVFPTIDRDLEILVLELRTWILAGKHPETWETISYPQDWWQHFRLRFFPEFWLGVYPVKYKRERVRTRGNVYVCPHADLKFRDPKHLEFIAQDSWKPGEYQRGPC